MTIPNLGRVTPIQIAMLGLAGMRVTLRGLVAPRDDAEMADTLRAARDMLQRLSGEDFGTDLVAWRAHLMAPELAGRGYQHPHELERVDGIVVAAIDDVRRKRVAKQLEPKKAP